MTIIWAGIAAIAFAVICQRVYDTVHFGHIIEKLERKGTK